VIFTCLVIFAIDGDTLRCSEGPNVRLWGLDAPEMHETGGNYARAVLHTLTAGSRVVCQHKGNSYNRRVGNCVREADGLNLTCAVIRAGGGIEWLRYSGGYFRGC
jgi:endonuclease YncB( thermonuclease family)